MKIWLHANKLALNIDKTNFPIFESPHHSSSYTVSIKIGNLSVSQTEYVKLLGILLNENLSWKYHLIELSKKLVSTCGMFFKVRHFLPIDVSICLYNSLFSPFLQYGILVWGLTYETHIPPMFLPQTMVLLAISFEHFTSSSTPLFSNLKILKLQDLFHLKLLIIVYECVKKISPIYFHTFFELVEPVHTIWYSASYVEGYFLNSQSTMQYGIRSLRCYGAKI